MDPLAAPEAGSRSAGHAAATAARSYDVIVVGGGLVGSAIAYGLAKHRRHVLVLDQGDVAVRPSRGNFGLVWVQSKGATMPRYGEWTRHSASLWSDLAEELQAETGTDVQHVQPGGVHVCLTPEEFEERAGFMHRMSNIMGPDYRYEMLDRKALAELIPEIGPTVAGASYCPLDGHANSLRLLRGLHAGLARRGGAYEPGHTVRSVRPAGGGFVVESDRDSFRSGQVVLAAGNGTPALAAMVGFRAPVRPQRGQIIVTAKAKPFLRLPTTLIRQTGEGGVMIGDSKEEVGFDDSTTPEVMRSLATRAVTTFPLLRDLRVVRAWGALRVMTPDGNPIYQQSETCPSAFIACVHSGVTLAAAHAGPLAEAIAQGTLPDFFRSFRAERFDVPETT